MDTQHQTRMRDELLEAWDDGTGDAEQAGICAQVLSAYIRADNEVAQFHLPAIIEVADGPLPVPRANMVLYECYQKGMGVGVDMTEARRRLELAVNQGSEIAEWFLASYLLDNTMLPVLPQDPDRALTILRRLAREADDMRAMRLARSTFSSFISRHVSIHDVHPQDLELVTQHADDPQRVASTDYLPLAMFFAREQSNQNYAGYEYRRSRELLLKGARSGSDEVRGACNAQLDAWGVNAVPEVEPTAAEKAMHTVKVAGAVGGISLILVFWSAVGLFLMSVAAAINAFTVPVLLGAFAVAFIVSRLRR